MIMSLEEILKFDIIYPSTAPMLAQLRKIPASSHGSTRIL